MDAACTKTFNNGVSSHKTHPFPQYSDQNKFSPYKYATFFYTHNCHVLQLAIAVCPYLHAACLLFIFSSHAYCLLAQGQASHRGDYALPRCPSGSPLCCLTVNIKCTQQLPIQLQTKLQAQRGREKELQRCSYRYRYARTHRYRYRYRCNYTYCAAALGQCAFPFGLIALPTRWQPWLSCQRAATSRTIKFLFNFVFISAPHAAQRTPFICVEHVSHVVEPRESAGGFERGGGGQ